MKATKNLTTYSPFLTSVGDFLLATKGFFTGEIFSICGLLSGTVPAIETGRGLRGEERRRRVTVLPTRPDPPDCSEAEERGLVGDLMESFSVSGKGKSHEVIDK